MRYSDNSETCTVNFSLRISASVARRGPMPASDSCGVRDGVIDRLSRNGYGRVTAMVE
jgi:hypothetical protein